MEKEKKFTNTSQFNKLVEEMEKNPALAKGFQKGSVPCDFKEQWERIATLLNALGPPKRAGDGWQKVWRDLKFKVKKKLVTNKAECTSTGGGIYKQLILSPLEETVANLLQFQKQLNPEGAVQGVQSESLEIEVLENENIENQIVAPSTSSQSAEHCTPSNGKEKSILKKTGSPNDHYELLQKHSDEQAQILKEIKDSISSMKRSLKDLSRYQKDLLDTEKKKYKLMFEENERQKEQHDTEMKIKRMKLIN